MIKDNNKCLIQTELGNCSIIGGFCSAVPSEYCEMARELNAYRKDIENGYLVRMACRPGDVFWEYDSNGNWAYPRIAHSFQHCAYIQDRLGRICFVSPEAVLEAYPDASVHV